MSCDLCKSHPGLMRVRAKQLDGSEYTTMVVCRCVTEAKRQAERDHPGGFESIGSLSHRAIESLKSPNRPMAQSPNGSIDRAVDAALTPADRKVAMVLRSHVGRSNAIRAADLALGIFDGAGDLKRKEEVRRGVTQSVERLRTFARLPIAATKEPPYGYFLAETKDEWDEMHERYMRELVRVARLARLFRPQADIVQRLRGQLQLVAQTSVVEVCGTSKDPA
jgi:hypothetical protein